MIRPTVIDLFAGVGGLSLGFETAGFDVVLANEFDADIAAAYTANNPGTNMIVSDITELPIEETFTPYVGKTTATVGGPPCQGFSQKGQRKSINDPRNFLFRHYFEVVKYVKPKYFVIENVPNLLTTERGLFKAEIIELFSSIGYTVTSGVCVRPTLAYHRTASAPASSAVLATRQSSCLSLMANTRQFGRP